MCLRILLKVVLPQNFVSTNLFFTSAHFLWLKAGSPPGSLCLNVGKVSICGRNKRRRKKRTRDWCLNYCGIRECLKQAHPLWGALLSSRCQMSLLGSIPFRYNSRFQMLLARCDFKCAEYAKTDWYLYWFRWRGYTYSRRIKTGCFIKHGWRRITCMLSGALMMCLRM